MRSSRIRLIVFSACFVISSLSVAAQNVVFGPRVFPIPAGGDQTTTEQFTLAGRCDLQPSSVYTLVVRNGDAGGGSRVSSASIAINSTEIVAERDFNQQVAAVERRVRLTATNTLSVRVKGGTTNGTVTITVQRAIDVREQVFGKTYTAALEPGAFEDTFTVADPAARFSVVAESRSPQLKHVSVRMNGTEIVSEQELHRFGVIEKNVPVASANQLMVVTKGEITGLDVSISIVRHVADVVGPQIILDAGSGSIVAPASPFAVRGTITDVGGVASLTVNGGPVPFDGAGRFEAAVTLHSGPNAVVIEALDCSGNTARREMRISLDSAPPVVTIVSPENDTATNTLTVAVEGTVNDDGPIASVTANGSPMAVTGTKWQGHVTFTGADGRREIAVVAIDASGRAATATVSLDIDRVSPTISARFEPPLPPSGWARGSTILYFDCADNSGRVLCSRPVQKYETEGTELVEGTAIDLAGNQASIRVPMRIDPGPPELDFGIDEYDDGIPAVAASPYTMTGTYSDDDSGTKEITCNGIAATLDGSRFTCLVPLEEFMNNVVVRAVDDAGNQQHYYRRAILDTTPPPLYVSSFTEPPLVVPDELYELRGSIPADASGVVSVEVNGVRVASKTGSFRYDVTLAEGLNEFTVIAVDRVGNRSTVRGRIQRRTPVRVEITEPADLATTSAATIDIRGQVSPPGASVTVNGIAASVTGNTFVAANVPLAQGRTVVTVTATSPAGVVAVGSVNLFRDSIPPRVVVSAPADRAMIAEASIAVSGMVDDIVVGTINADHVTVAVNGLPAQVANRAFYMSGVPLSEGENTLTVEATDRAGNHSVVTHRVTRDMAIGRRLMVVDGAAQRARIGAMLPDPVVVRLTDANGAAISGQQVTVVVAQNNGAIGDTADRRSATLLTDANGEVSIRWTLGTRAGAGNQRLRVSAQGTHPLDVHASADPGPPANIVVDMGSVQFGIVGERVPRPMIAIVVDAGDNRLADVPVSFTVLAGGGAIGLDSTVVVTTDGDGRAWVTPTLGPAIGADNNLFEARVTGLAASAIFTASGRQAGDPANTSIGGVVLDNSNRPIAGVTLRIDETALSVQTDAAGQFVLQHVPVGYLKLVADGSTALRPGVWPTLEFVLYTLPGVENSVGLPIYLLPIDVQRGLQVDERTGGTLTIPELPGVSLAVAPGSALFPSGGRAGTVSATLVHADKVPMAPNFGQQPRFVLTIQPTGVHFDPPARISFPNVDGLVPGEITELYSFDHDLGQFVPIGTGSVSEDGAVLVSDPGVGIVKGGWHFGGPPPPTGNASAVHVRLEVPKMGLIGGTVSVTATGTPAAGGSYRWELIDDPSDPTDDPAAAEFVTQPQCANSSVCTATLRGLKVAVATIRVTFETTATGTSQRVVSHANASAGAKTEKVPFGGIEVESVTYLNSHPLMEDRRGSVTVMAPAQWTRAAQSDDDRPQAPVAYTRSMPTVPMKMKLSARLRPVGRPLAQPLDGVTIRAVGGGFTFTATTDIAANVSSVLLEMESAETLPPTTKTYDPLILDWTYSVAGAAVETPLGRTANPVYVLLGNPLAGHPIYRSSLVLAATDGILNQSNVTEAIWTRFAGPANLTTWDKRPLYYYAAGANISTCEHESLKNLLTREDGCGQCTGFVRLLRNALAVNGVASQFTRLAPKVASEQFFVHNWEFDATPAFEGAADGYLYRYILPDGSTSPTDTRPVGEWWGDMRSIAGLPGQNMETPFTKIFRQHIVLKVFPNGVAYPKYLDPSYGVTFATVEEFQSIAVTGVAVIGNPVTVGRQQFPTAKVKRTGAEVLMMLEPKIYTGTD